MRSNKWMLWLLVFMGSCRTPAIHAQRLIPVFVCDNEADPSLDQFPNDKNVCTPVITYLSGTAEAGG